MNILQLIDELNKIGKTYIVGGYVRDYVMSERLEDTFESKDIDLLVVGCSQAKLAALAEQHNVKQVGKDFGVYLFETQDLGQVEVALARKERSTGNGSKDFDVDVNEYVTLEEDLARRDFTINAMAISMSGKDLGTIYDPFYGKFHIEQGLLHPVAGFSEDPTRVWRAARFALRFRLTFSDKLIEEMTNMPKEVNWPRWSVDFVKLCEQCPKDVGFEQLNYVFATLHETGWLKVAMPQLDKLYGMHHVPNIYHVENTWDHTMMVTANAIKYMDDPVVAMLAGLYHDTGKYDTQMWKANKGRYTYYGHEAFSAKHLRALYDVSDIPHSQLKSAEAIIKRHMLAHVRMSKSNLFDHIWNKVDLFELFLFSVCDSNGRVTGEGVVKDYQQLSDMGLLLTKWDREIKTTGQDLINLGYEPGPKFGERLKQLNRTHFYRVYGKVKSRYWNI